MFRRSLVALLTLAAPVWALPDGNLADEIKAFTTRPEYKQARWGILVVDAETGQTVYEQNADQLFLPASTTKLYSCAAALAAFGPDHRFETPVYQRGSLSNGTLLGDLILVAQGDLTMGGRTSSDGKMAFKNQDHTYANFMPGSELTDTDPLTGLKDLAHQVASAGIRNVSGDVLVDDRLFAKGRGSGSGPDILTPIVVNDNVIDALVTPAKEVGERAKIEFRPSSGLVQIDAQIDTIAEGQKAKVEVQPAGPQRYVVRGQVPAKAKPSLLILSVDDPAAFARALFIDALQKEGVTVAASALRPPVAELPAKSVYEKLQRVAVHKSLPFAELIKVTLKVSHNLYAGTLPILVSVKNGNGTLPDGLRRQGSFLSELKVPVETISFGGGAGGANADSVTPRATVELLRAMAKRPDFAVFSDALPILGVDGTLAEVVGADSPARGKVRAKTGTLLWQDVMNDRMLLTSKALAGYMTTAKGRELAFAMFVNGVPLPKGVTTTREGKALGKLCEIIVQHAP